MYKINVYLTRNNHFQLLPCLLCMILSYLLSYKLNFLGSKNHIFRNFMQVVLVANSLPALNDVTAMELPDIVAEAAKVC